MFARLSRKYPSAIYGELTLSVASLLLMSYLTYGYFYVYGGYKESKSDAHYFDMVKRMDNDKQIESQLAFGLLLM